MEIRSCDIDYRICNEDKIEGRAIVFESVSNVLYDKEHKRFFQEIMDRESINQNLVDSSDIKFLINHDKEHLVARRKMGKGSLNVEVREDGVYFSFNKPNTTDGNDLYEMIKRGDCTNCSFSFIDGDVEWDFSNRECPVRRVKSVKALFDLSAVFDPAYSATEINARSIDDLEAQYAAELEEVKPIEELKEEAGVEAEERGIKVKVEIEVEKEEKECEGEKPLEAEEPKECGCGDKQDDRACGEEKRSDDSYLEALKSYEDRLAAL